MVPQFTVPCCDFELVAVRRITYSHLLSIIALCFVCHLCVNVAYSTNKKSCTWMKEREMSEIENRKKNEESVWWKANVIENIAVFFFSCWMAFYAIIIFESIDTCSIENQLMPDDTANTINQPTHSFHSHSRNSHFTNRTQSERENINSLRFFYSWNWRRLLLVFQKLIDIW